MSRHVGRYDGISGDRRATPKVGAMPVAMFSLLRADEMYSQKSIKPDARPLHILVVIVGRYDSFLDDLPGAAALCNDVFEFWRRAAFVEGFELSTINVVANDPDPTLVMSFDRGDGTDFTPSEPTFSAVSAAVKQWVEQIEQDERSAGILQWVGHGGTFSQDGNKPSVLFTSEELKSGDAEGIGWSSTLNLIDERLDGHPVFCFVDACTTTVRSLGYLPALHQTAVFGQAQNAGVLYSVGASRPSFWISGSVVKAALDAGFDGEALGTRAFLRCLEDVGARFNRDAQRHPILSDEMKTGAKALMRRWATHLGLSPPHIKGISPWVGFESSFEPVVDTHDPKSVVDLIAPRFVKADFCVAKCESSGNTIAGQACAAGFEFLLPRGKHTIGVVNGATTTWEDLNFDYPHENILA